MKSELPELLGGHVIRPELLGAPFHRYQCGKCKRFIWYDEGCGHWHHWDRRG